MIGSPVVRIRKKTIETRMKIVGKIRRKRTMMKREQLVATRSGALRASTLAPRVLPSSLPMLVGHSRSEVAARRYRASRPPPTRWNDLAARGLSPSARWRTGT